METNFKKAVEMISDAYLEDAVELPGAKTIGDVFKFYEHSMKELREDFDFILNRNGFDSYWDDLSVYEPNGDYHTFKELLSAVKKVKVI